MTITEKADRLLLTGHVTVVAYSAIVRGDHGLYAVRREGDRWKCTCPALKRCSHIDAVERVT
jgi:hypothetical protein